MFNQLPQMIRKRGEKLCVRTMTYQSFKHTLDEELSSSSQCRKKAVTEVARLSRVLRHVDSVDGRLFDIRDGSIVADERAERKMREFKSAVRVLIGSRPVLTPWPCFTRAGEREPATLASLTQVANFMGITAQQRKLIRTAACREVTRHRVWVDTLMAVLNALSPELDFLDSRSPTKGTQMGRQILDNCLALLRDEKADPDSAATSWMKLKPTRCPSLSDPTNDPPRLSWEDVGLMFKDLIVCLRGEGLLMSHVVKLEAMKEGLSHVKDVSMDRTVMGYREAKQHEYEVRKILTTFLGYPSRCLFTLLLNYLFGQVRDIEIDLSGGFYDKGSNGFRLFAGRVLSSGQEEMVMSGMRQLDRAFRLFGFVFDTAGVKGVLDFEGHIWCVGAEARVIEYNGKRFFLHGITI